MKISRMVEKIRNYRVFTGMILSMLLIVMTITLSSCNTANNQAAHEKVCEKTTTEKYKAYLDLPENESQFTGVKIALVIDSSGSMQGDKMDRAKESSIKLIEDFDPHINIGLFRFSTNASMLDSFTTNKASLEESINEITPGGKTFLAKAFTLVKNNIMDSGSGSSAYGPGSAGTNSLLFDENNVKKINKIIILLTDGKPDDSFTEIHDLVQKITQNNICIYTIQYTSEEDKGSADMLELQKVLDDISQLSQDQTGCGKLYSNVKSNELSSVFDDIYAQIKTINYETVIDIKINNDDKIFLNNTKIEIPFDIRSVYNFKKVPNVDECIDPLNIKLDFLKDNNESNISLKLVDNYLLNKNQYEESYIIQIPGLEPGKYSILLNAESDPDGSNKTIKAFKKLDFRVVNDMDYFRCKQFTCGDMENSIGKTIAVEKNISIDDNDCIWKNLDADNGSEKPMLLNFHSIADKTKYLQIEKVPDESGQKEVFFLKPNETLRYYLGPGSYNIYCGGISDELFDINESKPLIIAIDTSLSMSGPKIEQAKLVAGKLMEGNKDVTIMTFNENAGILTTSKNSDIARLDLEKITLDGNSKIIPLLKLIDAYASKNKAKYQKNIKPSKTNMNAYANLTANQSKNSTSDYSNKTSGNSMNTSAILADTDMNNTYIGNIIIISDGILYDSANGKISNPDMTQINKLAENITSNGFRINTISYGEDNVLSNISSASNTTSGKGINKNIGTAYFDSIEKNSPQKILIKDYFKNAFDVKVNITKANKDNPFDTKNTVNFAINLKEHMFNSSFNSNIFDAKCLIEPKVTIRISKGTNVLIEKETKKVSKDTYTFTTDALPDGEYTGEVNAEIYDVGKRPCSINGKSTFPIDLQQSLIDAK